VKTTDIHIAYDVAQLIASRASGLALIARHRAQAQARRGERQGGQPDSYLADATLHLRSLSDAILGASERLFVDYVDWARSSNAARSISDSYLRDQLTLLRSALKEELPEAVPSADPYFRAALARLATPPAELSCTITPESLAAHYLERLLAYDRDGAMALVMAALDGGSSLRDVYLEVLQSVQHEIGRLWQLDCITVAQEHYCTGVSQLVLARLYPRMMHGPSGPRMVSTCACGELHEFGARMVADFFEMDGWDTTYLGANTPVDGVLQMLRARRAALLAVSVTMSSHLWNVRSLIEQVRGAADLSGTKILVGGQPFSTDAKLWRTLGADGWAKDAEEAVTQARALLES
jgi:methanogenic corrinoid protein MtbC1